MHSLDERLSFKAIGRILGKDCTTVSKEIKGHIIFEKKGAPYRPFNDCIHRNSCRTNFHFCPVCHTNRTCASCGKCTSLCDRYEKEYCPLLHKPPYVCNGCPTKHSCTLEKHIYDAHKAHKEYIEIKSEFRSDFNITEEELSQLNSVISPLLKKEQSLHHIMVNNADRISICERTAYIYVGNSLFDARNLDMPRTVRFQ